MSPATLPAASRLDRLWGQLLDSFVAMGFVLVGAVGFALGEVTGTSILFAAIVLAWLYILFADGLRDGQSFGKRAVGIAVVDATDGTPCSFGKSFLRNIFLMLGILDWIFIFGARRQRLGDKAANTVVVKFG